MTKPILCKYFVIAYSSISCNLFRTNFRGAYDPAVVVVNLDKQIYVKESFAVGQWSCSLSSTLKELQEYHQNYRFGFPKLLKHWKYHYNISAMVVPCTKNIFISVVVFPKTYFMYFIKYC